MKSTFLNPGTKKLQLEKKKILGNSETFGLLKYI